MGKRRRTEIARIADPAARLVTYSKRRRGLFKKASELCQLCGACAAVIVFSPAGKPCSFGDPSVEEVIRNYLCSDDEPVQPMGMPVEWIEKEWESCATEEDMESLIARYESVHDSVRKKLEDLEGNSSAIIEYGGDSVAGFGSSSAYGSDKELDFLFESFKAQCPALLEDCLGGGNGDAFSTSKSATGGGSWGLDSTPMSSCGLKFNPDIHCSMSRDCGGNFSTLPETLAMPGGSLGEELMAFDADEFLRLFDD